MEILSNKLRRLNLALNQHFNFKYLWYRLFQETKDIRAYSKPTSQDNVLISVVVPTYGIPFHMVEEFVQSIEKQSSSNWELCFCNDGDPDPRIGQFLSQKSKKYLNKIKVTSHESNQGITRATKSALRLAAGDYVLLADADDILHRKSIEIICNTIARSKPDFVYTNHDYMTDFGYRLHPMKKPSWSPELLLHVNYINHMKVVKTELLKKVCDTAFDDAYAGVQDWSLCFQMLMNAERIVHIPLYLYHWRSRKGSMANDVGSKPWAIDAQVRLRTSLVPSLNEKLKFDPSQNAIFFKGSVFSIFNFVIDLIASDSVGDLLRKIKTEVNSCSRTEQYVHFRMSSQQTYDPTQLAAYCELPNVACVWPFLDIGCRSGYTICDEVGSGVELSINLFNQNSYGSFSGNVLGGPLFGLTIKTEILRKIMDRISLDEAMSNHRQNYLDTMGFLISIEALKLGLRNVSLSHVRTSYVPKNIILPKEYVPQKDPFL